jgi:hypothetical protein
VELHDGTEKGILTSDEYIYELANQKDAINSSTLQLMKNAAVDCTLNYYENQEKPGPNVKPIKCFVYGGSMSDFLYDPRLDKDVGVTKFREGPADIPVASLTTASKKPIQPVLAEKKRIGGIEYLSKLNPDDNMIYIYNESDKEHTAPLFKLKKNPVTGLHTIKIKV